MFWTPAPNIPLRFYLSILENFSMIYSLTEIFTAVGICGMNILYFQESAVNTENELHSCLVL